MKINKDMIKLNNGKAPQIRMVYGVPTPKNTEGIKGDAQKIDKNNVPDEQVTLESNVADLDFDTEIAVKPHTQMVYGVSTPDENTHTVTTDMIPNQPAAFERKTFNPASLSEESLKKYNSIINTAMTNDMKAKVLKNVLGINISIADTGQIYLNE